MAEGEKVDLKKMVTGPTTGVFWVKTILYGLAFSALVFVGFGVYKTYFAKPKPTQDINVEAGGSVVIKNEANKRNLIFFGEPYVFAEGGNTSRTGVGVRAGLRWEF